MVILIFKSINSLGKVPEMHWTMWRLCWKTDCSSHTAFI